MNPADFLRAVDRSHHIAGTTCPRCQERLDRAAGVVDDDAPKPGDVSICSKCEALLEYQAGALPGSLSFRLMTDAEVAALPDGALLSLLDAIEGARIMRKAAEISASRRQVRRSSRRPRA